jgi:hypothetical protein
MLFTHAIARPCGHSYATDCYFPKPRDFIVTTTTAKSFTWNGPLRPSPNGGYEPAPLHMGGQITKEES